MTTRTGKEEKTRKTDRRTLYTRNVIKDALLDALSEKNFEQITVTDICRRAEITRATYYLHYQSLTEVLDELLVDALQLAEDSTANLNADVEQTAALLTADGTASFKANESLLPVCHRVAQLPKYQVIFHDETISGYVVNQIYQWQRPRLVPSFMKELGITKKEAEMLTLFIINGTYSVNKALTAIKKKIPAYRLYCRKNLPLYRTFLTNIIKKRPDFSEFFTNKIFLAVFS